MCEHIPSPIVSCPCHTILRTYTRYWNMAIFVTADQSCIVKLHHVTHITRYWQKVEIDEIDSTFYQIFAIWASGTNMYISKNVNKPKIRMFWLFKIIKCDGEHIIFIYPQTKKNSFNIISNFFLVKNKFFLKKKINVFCYLFNFANSIWR